MSEIVEMCKFYTWGRGRPVCTRVPPLVLMRAGLLCHSASPACAGYQPSVSRLEVVVEPNEIAFHAYCPALKGLHTCGDTENEAIQNAKDAATAYLQSLIKHGDPIPVGIEIEEEACRNSSVA